MVTLVWSRRAIRESKFAHTEEPSKSELPVRTDFSQNSWAYIVLKLPCERHAMLIFHWLQLVHTQCLFFIGHDSHPRIPCFPVIILLMLSTAGCICQQHPPGSSQVKVMYYNYMNWKLELLIFTTILWQKMYKLLFSFINGRKSK